VREHHALGETGGATGVNNGGQRVGRAAHIFHGRGCSQLRLQRQIACGRLGFAHVHPQPKGRQGVGQGLCGGHQAVVDRQRAGAAVVQRVGHFGRRPTRVDRVDDQPGPSPGQQQLDHAVAVEGQHRQALARLPVSLAAVACDGGDLVGVPLHRAVQTSGEVHACVSIGAAWLRPSPWGDCTALAGRPQSLQDSKGLAESDRAPTTGIHETFF
jgi:hypothetical protein